MIAGAETCDDGNVEPNDGCSATCDVEAGWACAAEPSVCDAAACGDGIAVCEETCDDGNTSAGDGCSPACLVEAGSTCGGEPSVCQPDVCGDGVVSGLEECDDGDTLGRDGCSQRCEVEANYTCEGGPSACDQRCDAPSALDAQSGECVEQNLLIACNARPGAPGGLTPLLGLGLVGLLLARRGRR